MTKTKYEVYRNHGDLSMIYVTTTRNCEDMIKQIRQIHEPITTGFNTNKLRIFRIFEGKKELVYTPKDSKFWGNDIR